MVELQLSNGVYFFVRTTTALKEVRARHKRDVMSRLFEIDDDVLGTNMWIGVGHRVDDWYEPATNITSIQQMIRNKNNRR